MSILVLFSSFWRRKTKPIYSYCVLCTAFCEREFEKTKPIYRPSAGNMKLEFRNPKQDKRMRNDKYQYQSTVKRMLFEKTNPI